MLEVVLSLAVWEVVIEGVLAGLHRRGSWSSRSSGRNYLGARRADTSENVSRRASVREIAGRRAGRKANMGSAGRGERAQIFEGDTLIKESILV